MNQPNQPTFLPKLPEGKRPLLGIVGYGFVGRAVENSFTDNFERFIVDPKIGTTIDNLIEAQPHLTYVCAPTPVQDSGRIDAKVVEDAVLKLMKRTNSAVVLKSTVTPDVIERLIRSFNVEDDFYRFIYAPEFLKERSSIEDYLDPEFMIFGGMENSISELLSVYRNATSVVIPTKVEVMNPVEASYVKYGINTFLATKVTFFNQLLDSMEKDAPGAVNPLVVTRAITNDSRIGNTHWRVPGPDNKRGFGGACFPKDLSAFVNYSANVPLLDKVKEINDNYRSEYELDEREESNNVNYGKTEEEQQGQDSGDSV